MDCIDKLKKKKTGDDKSKYIVYVALRF